MPLNLSSLLQHCSWKTDKILSLKKTKKKGGEMVHFLGGKSVKHVGEKVQLCRGNVSKLCRGNVLRVSE